MIDALLNIHSELVGKALFLSKCVEKAHYCLRIVFFLLLSNYLSLTTFEIKHHAPEACPDVLLMEAELGTHLQHARVFG
jgi:hypothetical protein